MLLYLIRHAHAVTPEADPRRPLSDKGRTASSRLGAFLRGTTTFHPAQIWHSPLERARQTAELLIAALNPEIMQVETDDLLPDDDPAHMASRLAYYPTTHDLALVGHEPHLAALATLLMRGKTPPVHFYLRKGAVIALERTDHITGKTGLPRWRVRWHLSPELLTAYAGG